LESNNVVFVKREGPVWYTIYHQLPVPRGVSSNASIHQPTNGKRASMNGFKKTVENKGIECDSAKPADYSMYRNLFYK